MGKNEDSTRRRVYKSCNIEEKCHEWWLHFPRIKYTWHGVKPTTHHRDNSRLSTIPFALTRYLCPPWKKSNDTEFPFSKFPIRRYTSFPPAGKETRFPSFSESEIPISKLHKRLFLVTVHRDEWIQSRGKSLREKGKTNERRKKLNFGTVSDFEML